MVREILLLGNPRLYESCDPVTEADAAALPGWVEDLHDTLLAYRDRYGAGRAVAAPQLGIKKRLIYMLLDKPYVLINPALTFPDGEQYELLDDCMSFPGLAVRVRRHKRCVLEYSDEAGAAKRMELSGDLAELVQHEYDHLDGILATMRAVDGRSFYMMQIKRQF